MRALSPVSADLIGRLRTLVDKFPNHGRAVLLLDAAERATDANAKELNSKILTFLKADRLWEKISPRT